MNDLIIEGFLRYIVLVWIRKVMDEWENVWIMKETYDNKIVICCLSRRLYNVNKLSNSQNIHFSITKEE